MKKRYRNKIIIIVIKCSRPIAGLFTGTLRISNFMTEEDSRALLRTNAVYSSRNNMV